MRVLRNTDTYVLRLALDETDQHKHHFNMPTTLDLTPEQIANYRAHALRRRQQEQPEIERRREQAWQAAREAARLLKEEFNATRVVVFGSLARGSGFTQWSDVDVAAWGLAQEDTFRAIGATMDLETEVPVNLVDVNTVRPSLLSAIEREGIAV
jgi:predicted nucleotidyltransferase